MSGSVRSAQVRIDGRVQGVGYRLWTQRAAQALGLSGWVRNRRDGSVEAVFQGADADVTAMITQCRSGPYGARVTHIEVLGEPDGTFNGFEVRETL